MRLELVATPDNPIPPCGEVEGVRALKNLAVRAAFWPATRSDIRGTVCVMPGRSEFIEKYFEVVTDLRARGFAVCVLDWHGQGGSQRVLKDTRKGHVSRFEVYVADLKAVISRMEARDCPKPFFGLAHSMGGAALLTALARGESRLTRAVLCAPMIALHPSRRPVGTGLLAELYCRLGRGQSYIPGGSATSLMTRPFARNVLTSDPARYARAGAVVMAAEHLGLGDPTIGWLRSSYRVFREFARLDFGFRFETPLLFVLAGADTLVWTPAAEALADRIKGAAAITIPQARHELMMEADIYRDQFWAAFDAFVPGERPAKAATAA